MECLSTIPAPRFGDSLQRAWSEDLTISDLLTSWSSPEAETAHEYIDHLEILWMQQRVEIFNCPPPRSRQEALKAYRAFAFGARLQFYMAQARGLCTETLDVMVEGMTTTSLVSDLSLSTSEALHGLHRAHWELLRELAQVDAKLLQASRTRREYSTNSISQSVEDGHESDCAICLERIDSKTAVTTIHCHHTFCRDCLHTWINSEDDISNRHKCPMCRQDLFQGPEQPDPTLALETKRMVLIWEEQEIVGTMQSLWFLEPRSSRPLARTKSPSACRLVPLDGIPFWPPNMPSATIRAFVGGSFLTPGANGDTGRDMKVRQIGQSTWGITG